MLMLKLSCQPPSEHYFLGLLISSFLRLALKCVRRVNVCVRWGKKCFGLVLEDWANSVFEHWVGKLTRNVLALHRHRQLLPQGRKHIEICPQALETHCWAKTCTSLCPDQPSLGHMCLSSSLKILSRQWSDIPKGRKVSGSKVLKTEATFVWMLSNIAWSSSESI